MVSTNEMADHPCLLRVLARRHAGRAPKAEPGVAPGRGGAQRSRLDPVRLDSAVHGRRPGEATGGARVPSPGMPVGRGSVSVGAWLTRRAMSRAGGGPSASG